ncbi:MAG: glycosyltransferase family 4 protein, partial [Clostridia bacterium]|nr:glycosyltransferase family 4 protein [Clostridia bacterium]
MADGKLRKLIFIHHSGDIGGAGLSLIRTVKEASRDFEVKAAVPEGSDVAAMLEAEQIPVLPYDGAPGTVEYYSGGPAFMGRTYVKRIFRRRPFRKKLLGIISSEKPDGVVLNSLTLSYLAPAIRRAGIPCGIFVRETFPRKGLRIMLRKYRRLLGSAEGVYFISRFDRDFWKITGTDTYIIRNSVPESFFEPQTAEDARKEPGLNSGGQQGLEGRPETGNRPGAGNLPGAGSLPDTTFSVLYLGGVSPLKGINVISKAAELLPGNVEILAAGDSAEAMRPFFAKAQAKVRCLGLLADTRPAYGAADAVVIPITAPHQARPVFEAGAASCPVIVSDFPELSEYAENGRNCLTVPPGDPGRLAEAIVRLMENPAERKALSAENLKLSRTNHSPEAASGAIRHALGKLTARRFLFVTNAPSPYRVDFLNKLSESIPVTAVFDRRGARGRVPSWFSRAPLSFAHVFLRGVKTSEDSAFAPGILRVIKKNRGSTVCVSGYSSPTEALAIMKLRAMKKDYFLSTDGGFIKDAPGSLKFRIKEYFVKGAAGYFSTSESCDRFLVHYGADPGKLIRYPFTSLHECDIREVPPSPAEKQILRARFGLPSDRRIAVACGRFIESKGFAELINASQSVPDLLIVICGDEPPAVYVDLIGRNTVKNVRLLGFQSKNTLKDLFSACDFFVLPTRTDVWGLVVNEAMAEGLPVITTDMCGAGLALVRDNENGLLIPISDSEKLADALRSFAQL